MKCPPNRFLWLLLASLLPALPALGQASPDWPREIDTALGTLTLYQPQVESLEGNNLEARAAISWQKPDEPPVFGAVWLEAELDVDRAERTATVRDLRVADARFPDATEEELTTGKRLLESELPRWELTYPLDELLTDLDPESIREAEDLRNEPPEILVARKPKVLVQFDGEPRFEDFEGPEGARLARAVNTPFLVVRDPDTGDHWLSAGGDNWYRADDVLGPWTFAASVPTQVAALVEEAEDTEQAGTEDTSEEPGPPPEIVIATEPTELIVFAGDPTWQPIDGTSDLLYADNTDSDVFLDIPSQHYYLLLSGRWYWSPAVDADLDWQWVANDEIPEAFGDIDPDSITGEVLPHVAGTREAREAILDATVPQTAILSRDDNSFEVDYDGDDGPIFEPIEGADSGLEAAANTAKSVFKLHDRYWACEQGAWYESSSPTGPWTVATEVPAEIASIPASSPHHNVTYVNVYDVTPQTVVVGYTPGYTHSYISHGSIVYGTGWYYRPWWGPYYYPRPWTWGVHVRYNPWYGWSFGLSYSNGPFSYSFGRYGWGGYWRPPYYGGWWGPGYYRPYPRPTPYAGYHKRPTPAPYARPATRPTAGARPATRDLARNNIYARPENRDRLAAVPQPADRRTPPVARDRANDVLTDRQGNVYRRDGQGGWQQRTDRSWKPADGLDRPGPTTPGVRPSQPSTRPSVPTTRPTTPSTRPTRPSTRPATPSTRPGLERDWSSRQRGMSRSSDFRAGRSRPSGGMRRPPR